MDSSETSLNDDMTLRGELTVFIDDIKRKIASAREQYQQADAKIRTRKKRSRTSAQRTEMAVLWKNRAECHHQLMVLVPTLRYARRLQQTDVVTDTAARKLALFMAGKVQAASHGRESPLHAVVAIFVNLVQVYQTLFNFRALTA